MFFKKRRKDKKPSEDQQLVQPTGPNFSGVSFTTLGLDSEDVARANQELSANFGKRIKLNARKLDTSITKLQMQLHNLGFDILVTGRFALQVVIEESRRAYRNVTPEPAWVIAVVIEAERRVRIYKTYAESYTVKPKEIDEEIGKMKDEAADQKGINRLAKHASTSSGPSIEIKERKKILLEEAAHLARMDYARAELGLEKGAKLPHGALKKFLDAEVSDEDMRKYYEIAQLKYQAMHGQGSKGKPKEGK